MNRAEQTLTAHLSALRALLARMDSGHVGRKAVEARIAEAQAGIKAERARQGNQS